MLDGYAVADALSVGDKVGEVEIQITDEMVDVYMAAMGDPEPMFQERGTDGRRMAHPELLARFAMPILWMPFFRQMPVIRAKQLFAFSEPVKTGTTYRATGYCVDKYEKRDKRYMVFEANFVDESGNHVLKDKRTLMLVEKGLALKG